MSIARNIKAYVRWIPGELNASDAPARIFDIESHSGQSLFKKLSGILGRHGAEAGARFLEAPPETRAFRGPASSAADASAEPPREESAKDVFPSAATEEVEDPGSPDHCEEASRPSSAQSGPGVPESDRRDRLRVIGDGQGVQRCDLLVGASAGTKGEAAPSMEHLTASHDGGSGRSPDHGSIESSGESDGEVEHGTGVRGGDCEATRLLQPGRAPARRGCRGRRGARPLFQRLLCERASGPQEVCMAALTYFLPRFSKVGEAKLPRAWRALKGWRRRAPSRSRVAYPFQVWAAIIWMLCLGGHWGTGA